jgi:hypothetical protein
VVASRSAGFAGGLVAQSAAKAALSNLGKALAEEFGARGLRVNTISPGPVWTDSWTSPGVILRTARTAVGQAAAASHTGALARDGAVVDASLRHVGAVLVEDLADLVDQTVLLTGVAALTGRRVGIFTLPGGAAALTSDLVVEYGLELAEFSDETYSKPGDTGPGSAGMPGVRK